MKQDTLEGKAKTKNGVKRLCFSIIWEGRPKKNEKKPEKFWNPCLLLKLFLL